MRRPGHTAAVAASLLLLVLVPPSAARADRNGLELRWEEPWCAVFAESQATFHVSITAKEPFSGRLTWVLRLNQRTLARREQSVTGAPNKPARVEMRVDIPPVKEGVVVPAALTVAVFATGGREATVAAEKRLRIFPKDPFHLRKTWLEELRLRLLDPEETTAEVFDDAKIPYESVRSPQTLEGEGGSMLVVGAGVSFEDYRGLAEDLVRLAAGGCRVLCLSPAGGEMTLPGTAEAELPAPLALAFRQADVITELDKRLDPAGWPPNGKLVASALVVKAGRAQVVGEIVPDGRGWPWFAAEFASGGKLVLCGFPIMEKWRAGPTPRFLFARILEWLTEKE